jgi:3-phenylpropionate/cinnamic acid dioxygenase small subunit
MSEITAGAGVSAEEYIAIANFLHREARLLDERRYEEWLALLDENMVYEMPLTMTRERVEQDRAFDHEMEYFAENLASLTMRVERLKTDYAWAEDPPTRTRHMIGNLEIASGDEPGRYEARCTFVVFANRGNRPSWEQLVGHRRDVLVRRDAGWRLARRTLFLDQAVLGANSISILL